jgi:hypothetical protein
MIKRKQPVYKTRCCKQTIKKNFHNSEEPNIPDQEDPAPDCHPLHPPYRPEATLQKPQNNRICF